MAQRRKLTDEMVESIREKYATGEFTMSDLSTEFGASVSVISNAITKGYHTRTQGMIETAQRTELIESHIMKFFESEEELIETIKANIFGNRTVRIACNEVIEGGCLLVYYEQIDEFLKMLDCKLSENDKTNWSMYKKIVANRMVKMYEKCTNKEG